MDFISGITFIEAPAEKGGTKDMKILASQEHKNEDAQLSELKWRSSSGPQPLPSVRDT